MEGQTQEEIKKTIIDRYSTAIESIVGQGELRNKLIEGLESSLESTDVSSLNLKLDPLDVPIDYDEMYANVRRNGGVGSIHIVTRLSNCLSEKPPIETYRDLVQSIEFNRGREPYLDRRGVGGGAMEVILAHLKRKDIDYENKTL